MAKLFEIVRQPTPEQMSPWRVAAQRHLGRDRTTDKPAGAETAVACLPWTRFILLGFAFGV